MLYDNFTGYFGECKGSIFKKSQIAANSRNCWDSEDCAPALPGGQSYDDFAESAAKRCSGVFL